MDPICRHLWAVGRTEAEAFAHYNIPKPGETTIFNGGATMLMERQRTANRGAACGDEGYYFWDVVIEYADVGSSS